MDCRNLRAELVRYGISRKQAGKAVGLSHEAMDARFQGRTDFKVGEIVGIRDAFFPGLSIDYLAGLSDDSGR